MPKISRTHCQFLEKHIRRSHKTPSGLISFYKLIQGKNRGNKDSGDVFRFAVLINDSKAQEDLPRMLCARGVVSICF